MSLSELAAISMSRRIWQRYCYMDRGRQNLFWNLWVLSYQIKAESALFAAHDSEIDLLCTKGVYILKMPE